MIAFLGTGLLGANFTRALLRRGEQVQVWNRTAAKARTLEAAGAVVFDDPADAVRGAMRVHLTLSDDAAVDAVLLRAQAGFATGTVIVDHTTTSARGTAARARYWNERGIAFQHAPVFMGPENALAGTGMMLASGDSALFHRLSVELEKMTGKLLYLGPIAERAAGMKLLGNLFLIAMTCGLIDTMALAKAMGISIDDVGTLFDAFNPGAQVPARINRMRSADFSHPSWELAMARKDVRLMIEEATSGRETLAVMPAIAAEMDTWIDRGHAQHDWTVIASDVIR
jgi:3-hydroxyisobutyrate dehydrogenase